MSAGARRFFSGETEAQAVLEAAGCFGLAPGDLAYRPVAKKHGFLRRPKVVIEVDPESPRRSAGSPEAAAAGPSPTVGAPAVGSAAGAPRPARPPRREVAEAVPGSAPRRAEPAPGRAEDGDGSFPLDSEAAAGLPGALAAAAAVAALAGLRLEVRGEVATGDDGDELRVELVGADRALLVSRQGELLRTCEYLVRRMVGEPPPGGLSLDSAGFRTEREQALRRRAAAAAEEVRRSGEPVRFEPLPAAERRILHLAIQGEPAVRSASDGDGELRSVCVLPGGPETGGASPA